jgi:hypothetical protein
VTRPPVAVVALAAIGTASWAGTLLAPALASSNPLLLILLAPRVPFVALAAHSEPLMLVWAAALVRSNLHVPFNFAIGRRYGGPALSWLTRRVPLLGRVAGLTVRLFSRASYLAVVVRPNQTIVTLAGAAGLRPILTGVCALAGSATYLGAVVASTWWVTAQL